MKVVLEVENSKEGRALINFLKQLSFVRIQKSSEFKKECELKELFGIWKDRNVTKKSLREKAWRM